MAFCASEFHEIELINELLAFDLDDNFSPDSSSSSSPKSDDSLYLSDEDKTVVDCSAVTIQNKKRKIKSEIFPSNHLDLAVLGLKPNEASRLPRRRVRVREKPILYVFPSYDKCDSLVYFPHAMSRHINTADFSNLSKLFNTHFNKACDVTFSCLPTKPTGRTLVKVFECLNEVHPDSVMCVHNTKVVENQIIATAYTKFTDCRAIVNSLRRTAQDPMLQQVLQMCSDEGIKERIREAGALDQQEVQYMKLVDANVDIVVYLSIDIVMTLDDTSRKISAIKLNGRLSSMRPLDVNYSASEVSES